MFCLDSNVLLLIISSIEEAFGLLGQTKIFQYIFLRGLRNEERILRKIFGENNCQGSNPYQHLNNVLTQKDLVLSIHVLVPSFRMLICFCRGNNSHQSIDILHLVSSRCHIWLCLVLPID